MKKSLFSLYLLITLIVLSCGDHKTTSRDIKLLGLERISQDSLVVFIAPTNVGITRYEYRNNVDTLFINVQRIGNNPVRAVIPIKPTIKYVIMQDSLFYSIDSIPKYRN